MPLSLKAWLGRLGRIAPRRRPGRRSRKRLLGCCLIPTLVLLLLSAGLCTLSFFLVHTIAVSEPADSPSPSSSDLSVSLLLDQSNSRTYDRGKEVGSDSDSLRIAAARLLLPPIPLVDEDRTEEKNSLPDNPPRLRRTNPNEVLRPAFDQLFGKDAAHTGRRLENRCQRADWSRTGLQAGTTHPGDLTGTRCERLSLSCGQGPFARRMRKHDWERSGSPIAGMVDTETDGSWCARVSVSAPDTDVKRDARECLSHLAHPTQCMEGGALSSNQKRLRSRVGTPYWGCSTGKMYIQR